MPMTTGKELAAAFLLCSETRERSWSSEKCNYTKSWQDCAIFAHSDLFIQAVLTISLHYSSELVDIAEKYLRAHGYDPT